MIVCISNLKLNFKAEAWFNSYFVDLNYFHFPPFYLFTFLHNLIISQCCVYLNSIWYNLGPSNRAHWMTWRSAAHGNCNCFWTLNCAKTGFTFLMPPRDLRWRRERKMGHLLACHKNPTARGTQQPAPSPKKSAMANYSKTTVQSGLEKVRALERQHV